MTNSPADQEGLRKVLTWISNRLGDMSKRSRNDQVALDIHGVRIATKAVARHMVQIIMVLEQLLGQMEMVNRNLSGIQEELRRQNILASSGGTGAKGFANIVYSFVNMHAKTGKRKNDLFFVWHPDTSWHSIFYEMVTEKPLPSSFWGESDNLDKLCLYMQAIRHTMSRDSWNRRKPVFHLLIPSWYDIRWVESVRFPDEVLPLRVVGPTHDMGRPLVSFSLPVVQNSLELDGIGNSFDQDEEQDEGLLSGLLIFSGIAGAGICTFRGHDGNASCSWYYCCRTRKRRQWFKA